MYKFWIVWSPQGKTPPCAKHPVEETANNEAVRLARLNPGHEFFVMGMEALAIKRDIDFIRPSKQLTVVNNVARVEYIAQREPL